MSDNKNIISSTFKTSLNNDCTNHLALQLEQCRTQSKAQQRKVNSSYESPLADIVTYAFIRGYN
ncbi:MAG TPA: hypothetical protein VIS54_08085 [Psychromonas sp.]